MPRKKAAVPKIVQENAIERRQCRTEHGCERSRVGGVASEVDRAVVLTPLLIGRGLEVSMWTAYLIRILILALMTSCSESSKHEGQKPSPSTQNPANAIADPDFCDPDTFKQGMGVIPCAPLEDEICGTRMSPFYLEDQPRCTEFI